MRLPNRPSVESLQCCRTTRHVAKASEPNESIGIIKIAKLAEDIHSQCFLWLDEFTIEQIDQHIAFSAVKRVLPQFDDRTTGLHLVAFAFRTVASASQSAIQVGLTCQAYLIARLPQVQKEIRLRQSFGVTAGRDSLRFRCAPSEGWARQDSNLGPRDYESPALPLSYRPIYL